MLLDGVVPMAAHTDGVFSRACVIYKSTICRLSRTSQVALLLLVTLCVIDFIRTISLQQWTTKGGTCRYDRFNYIYPPSHFMLL